MGGLSIWPSWSCKALQAYVGGSKVLEDGSGPLRSESSGSSDVVVPGILHVARSAQIHRKMVTGMMIKVMAMPSAAGMSHSPNPFIW